MEKGLISIRPCKKSDCKFLWNLRNEKTTRDSAFNKDYIAYSRHVKWFNEKITNERSYIFIVLRSRKKIGQVRLDVKDRANAEVDIGIVKAERGRGFGSCALNLVCSYGLHDLGLKRIIAHIKKENAASFRAFANANFSNTGLVRLKRERAYRMVLNEEG